MKLFKNKNNYKTLTASQPIVHKGQPRWATADETSDGVSAVMRATAVVNGTFVSERTKLCECCALEGTLIESLK